MTSAAALPCPSGRRLHLLAVLGLLVGLLGMHVLVTPHEAAASASAAASPSAAVRVTPLHERVATTHHDGIAGENRSMPDCADCGGHPPSHGSSHLLDLCLAVLVAGGLLGLVLRRAVTSTLHDVRRWSDSRRSLVAAWPSPRPARPPSLPLLLCIQRT